MKIVVVGTGAMGSIYAGYLTKAGNEVWAIDNWTEHLDKIEKSGLIIEARDGRQKILGIKTTGNISSIVDVDLYIIATKAMEVDEATRAIAGKLNSDTVVLTIQNGLGVAEIISKNLNKTNILLGVADGFGAHVKNPGHVYHHAMKLIRIGRLDCTPRRAAKRVLKIWKDAGFKVREFSDINQLVWEKFICNVTFSGPCTVLRCTVGELMKNSDMWKIALACGLEAYELGCMKGIIFSFTDPRKYITGFGQRMPDAQPSMLQDHLSFKHSEIDFINGMVTTLGQQVGMPTPYNEAISAIIKFRELRFKKTAN